MTVYVYPVRATDDRIVAGQEEVVAYIPCACTYSFSEWMWMEEEKEEKDKYRVERRWAAPEGSLGVRLTFWPTRQHGTAGGLP